MSRFEEQQLLRKRCKSPLDKIIFAITYHALAFPDNVLFEEILNNRR